MYEKNPFPNVQNCIYFYAWNEIIFVVAVVFCSKQFSTIKLSVDGRWCNTWIRNGIDEMKKRKEKKKQSTQNESESESEWEYQFASKRNGKEWKKGET